jgi:hypothetical protein
MEGRRLADLRPVQALAGDGAPFDRLAARLSAGAFAAAAIDAPFCIPERHLPPGGQAELVRMAGATPLADDRPFPRGAALVELARRTAELDTVKPVREAERAWRRLGLNVRSSLWDGPRGGAPFAAACLTLLARAQRPMWPWASGQGMLAETFPAGQLRAWGLPFDRYGDAACAERRAEIVEAIRHRIDAQEECLQLMRGSADALDAVLAAFGAMAAASGDLAMPPPAPVPADGWIAVHR